MTSMDGVKSDSDVSGNPTGERVNVTSFTASKKCCSRVGCSKYGLFVVNFLVWAAGGVLMGVGTWSRLKRDTVADFDDVTVDVAYLLIGIGAVMFVVSLFGCLGALRESLCLLKVFIITVVIVFVAQMVAGVLAFVMLDTVESRMMDLIRDTIVTYNTPKASMDQALDNLQKEYKCCGGASYRDWEANPLYNCSSSIPSRCGVPTSCCYQPGDNCGEWVLQYPEDYARLKIHTRGCIGALMSIFKDNLVIIGVIAFAVGFLQVCSLLMAHCLMRYIVSDGKFTM
ncbi:tetraspanin-33-like [Babylonia areolata]|uniref:tetraspanin-33-like n=1 Tax=Babylonia areolata TaxID=304850 RepID=UPI003FCF3D06